MKNFNPGGLNLVVLQLNIRSILSHVTELKMLVHILETKNSRVDIILLCETFLNKTTEKQVKIPGYTLICNSRSENKGGGTAILLRNGINYKRRKDIEVFKEKSVELTIIEITAKDGKKIIVGSMYHPPNTTITRPTRICQNTATLIDNIFVSRNLHKYFESAIILDDISDHLPLLVLLKQTKLLDNKPINFESRKLNENTIMLIKQKLFQVDWTRLLNATNCSDNFDLFSSKLNKIMDSVSPLVKVKISAKTKYHEPWMT